VIVTGRAATTQAAAAGRGTAARAAGAPLIEVRGLAVDYGAGPGVVHAVTDASLILASGTVLGLAGESGSGKSTLAYAMTRLLRAPGVITGGEVLLHGPARRGTGTRTLDLLAADERQVRELRWSRVAAVMQSATHALNPMMTIGTHLAAILDTYLPGLDHAGRRERAGALLDMVGIRADRLGRYPHQLPDEMRQRVMIAMALALEPAVVIMDEPAMKLDVTTQRQILHELTRLQKWLTFSVLFITRDLPLLMEIADSVAIMYAGRLEPGTGSGPAPHAGWQEGPRLRARLATVPAPGTVPRPRAVPHLVAGGDNAGREA